jgi:predicted LPLAT superfamily acyltransferase
VSNPVADPRRGARNPGPSWGYRFLRLCDRLLPEVIFKPLRAIGTWVAMLGMPAERRHSRAYLATVLPQPPTWRDVFRHFFAFEESLMLKLRVINGAPHRGRHAVESTDFAQWLQTDRPALLGTFHIGTSDLMGFLMAGYAKRRTYLVRLRVGNSHDTDQLARLFGDNVQFVWINDPREMLFALKDAAAAGDGAIALQCDREEFSARTAAFDFLGARRRFPVTIYHLAQIFGFPVLMSFGIPSADPEVSVLHSAPLFEVRPGESRAAMLVRAEQHFQAFLHQVEAMLREQPYQWFNFLPLNTAVDEAAGAKGGRS